MNDQIKAGIVGGAGFAAGELIRILLRHPSVEIDFITSDSQEGKPVSLLHQDLEGESDLVFTRSINTNVDVIFLCRGHGESAKFLGSNAVSPQVKVIDLSQDFRLLANADRFGRNFIYGLPELNKEEVRMASSIANPGCFATGIELALLPLVAHIDGDVHINSITGSTGAGQNPSPTSMFSWRDNNISTYKVFEHQHLHEIRETISKVNRSFNHRLFLVPVRGNFTRGIFSTLYTKTSLAIGEIENVYEEFYVDQPFVRISKSGLDLKKVVNTNNVYISLQKKGDIVFIESIIDNLLKGASGQAVQNMNLMFGFPEIAGLALKASAF